MERLFGFKGSFIHYILFSLFFLALFNSPLVGVSFYVLLFCLFSILICWKKTYFDRTSVYLLLFSISYPLVLCMNTGKFNPHYLLYLIAPITFYVWGQYIVTKINNQKGLLNFILLVLFFFAAQTYIITIEDVKEMGLINPMRAMLREGDEEAMINATLFGLNVSLGLSGLAIFMALKNKFGSIRGFLFLCVFLLSLLTVIHLVNRTGIVVAVVCTLCSYFFSIRKSGTILNAILQSFLIMAIVLFLISIFSKNGFDIIEAYTNRLSTENSSISDYGGRSWRWVDAMGRLFTNPFGWNNDVEYSFVHNLWLDVAMFGGIFPFIFIVCATIRSLKQLFQLMKLKNDIIANIIFSLSVCFILSSFVEPVLVGFDLYFYLYCMIWGIQKKYIEYTESGIILFNE